MLSFSLQLVNIPILSRIFPHLLLQSSATRLKAKNTGWMLVTSSSALMQLRHWLQLIHSWLTLVYLRQEYNFVSSCPSQHIQWSSRFSRFLSSPPVTKLLSSPPPQSQFLANLQLLSWARNRVDNLCISENWHRFNIAQSALNSYDHTAP